jgi:hypothetical protein
MADNRTDVSIDLAEHEATYRGFLLLMKVTLAATIITLGLLYFFLVR